MRICHHCKEGIKPLYDAYCSVCKTQIITCIDCNKYFSYQPKYNKYFYVITRCVFPLFRFKTYNKKWYCKICLLNEKIEELV